MRDTRDVGRGFVGRRQELGAARDLLERTVAGEGNLLLVGGDAGIGKSRFVEELAALAHGNATVTWGRCWEAGGAPPYWPWVEALGALAREIDVGTLAATLGDALSD